MTDLLSVLNQTELQKKEPRLYQVLKELIDRPIAVPPAPPNVEVYNIDTRSSAQSVYLQTAIKPRIFYIITDMFGNAAANPITLVGIVSGIVNPTISSDYGVIKVYATVDGYQFWGGTAAGTFGPGNPNESVQYNDNGLFGGSKLFYDKILETFSLIDPTPLNYIALYGFYESSSSSDRRMIEMDLTLLGNGNGTAISGYLLVDGGTHTGDSPAICATEGFLDFNSGTAEYVKALLGALNLNGGTISIIAQAVHGALHLDGATVERLVAVRADIDLDTGNVNISSGVWVNTPHDGSPGAIPIEHYGIKIDNQTIPGIADPTKNWALHILGGTVNTGIKATGIPNVNGLDGVSGTFTTVDGKTVTATRGWITSIV